MLNRFLKQQVRKSSNKNVRSYTFPGGLGALKGTSFHTYISVCSAFTLCCTYLYSYIYVTKLLLSGNGINLALIYLLISTEVSRTTACLGYTFGH